MVALVGVNEPGPERPGAAIGAVLRCLVTSFRLLAERRIHLRPEFVGRRLGFADGTSATVYRETVVDRGRVDEPAFLAVAFQLRLVRGAFLHWLFRRESLLNTPLFVGFPGFVSKLWVAHDERGVYRGLYQWDGPDRAVHYARCLWWVLALVCRPESIRYQVLPGGWRDEVVETPGRLLEEPRHPTAPWWWPADPRS